MAIGINSNKPALRFYGGKWNIGKWIISHWPRHKARVIPFAGGLNEELQAPLVKIITANDADGRVFNFFHVLRECPDALVNAIRFTPWHEDEYKLGRIESDDPLEDARRFWCACWMSVQGGPNPGKSGFRLQKQPDGRWARGCKAGVDLEHLYAISNRLKFIQFLNRDAREIIEMHLDIPDTLIYCDPPYLKETRAVATGYTHDSDLALHIETAELLNKAKGYVVVCGYSFNQDGTPNEVYKELYESRGWVRKDITARTNSGGDNIESLWLSPKTALALNKPMQNGLFDTQELWTL